jgi:hypothetical protein
VKTDYGESKRSGCQPTGNWGPCPTLLKGTAIGTRTLSILFWSDEPVYLLLTGEVLRGADLHTPSPIGSRKCAVEVVSGNHHLRSVAESHATNSGEPPRNGKEGE